MAQPASQYRINKFRTYFNFVDVNKDGYLTIDDYETTALNMARLSNANEERRIKLKREMMQWWSFTSGGNRDARITIEDCVQNNTDYCSVTDAKIHAEASNETHRQMFDIIDTNGDNLISREELKIFYNSHGVADDEFVQRVFDLIDTNKNGVISRDEFVKAITDFWTSDDPKNGFEILFDPEGSILTG